MKGMWADKALPAWPVGRFLPFSKNVPKYSGCLLFVWVACEKLPEGIPNAFGMVNFI